MNDIFSKLNSLKSIEPSESWVVDTKKRVLSEAPVFERKSVLDNNIDKVDSRLRGNDKEGFNIQDLFQNLTFKKLMVPAFSLVFVLSAGIFTLGASKSSLPGEFLYPIKMANENLALTIASKDKKAEVEMEQVGKRIEEFGKISQNHFDPKQGEKAEMLLGEIEIKTNKSNQYLAEMENDDMKVKIAKRINIQSKKQVEDLTEKTEDFPDVVKDKISEEVAGAIESNKKLNFDSLAVMTEMTDNDKNEIISKLNDEISQIENEIKALESEFVLLDSQVVSLNEAKEKIEKAKQELEDNNLVDTVGSIIVVQKIILELKNNATEDVSGGSPITVDDNSDDGDVLGVEDCICEIGAVDECGCEEIIKEETEEEIVKEEVDGGVNENGEETDKNL